MSRFESQAKLGAYPLDKEFGDGIINLFELSNKFIRILDPFCNSGERIAEMASAWNADAYGVEIQEEFARAAQERLGYHRVLWEDTYRVKFSHNSFSVIYLNPPYDFDRTDTNETNRAEVRALKHFIKYLQPGGAVIWVAYAHHLTEDVAKWLFKNLAGIYPFYLGKHLGTYDQICVVGVKHRDKDAFKLSDEEIEKRAAVLAAAKDNIEKLRPIAKGMPKNKFAVSEENPRILLPASRYIKRMLFESDKNDPVTITESYKLICHVDDMFNQMSLPKPRIELKSPVGRLKTKQLAVVLAGGMMNGMPLEYEGKKAIIRGSVAHKTYLIKSEEGTTDGGKWKVEQTFHTIPTPRIIILDEEGHEFNISKDEELVKFIESHALEMAQHFEKNYPAQFDMTIDPVWGEILDKYRIKGKHDPLPAQELAAVASAESLMRQGRHLIVGEPSVGKTSMALYAALMLRQLEQSKQIVFTPGATTEERKPHREFLERLSKRYNTPIRKLRGIKAGKVIIVLCPANMPGKWVDEITSQIPEAVARDIRDVRQARQIIEDAKAKPDVPHFAVITLESAKMSETRIPAFEIHRGLSGYGRTWESNGNGESSRPIYRKNIVICPTTGQALYAKYRGKRQEIKLDTIRNSSSFFFYEGPVPDGYEWQDASYADTQNHRRRHGHKSEAPEKVLRPQHWMATSQQGLAMWQDARQYGLPKAGNGRVTTKSRAITIRPKSGMLPHYTRTENYAKGTTIQCVLKPYQYREFQIERLEIEENLTGEKILDSWIAKKGIRCTEEIGKNRKIEKLMKKHGLKKYTHGGGHKDVDEEMNNAGVYEYNMSRTGQTVIRNPKYALADYFKRNKDAIGVLYVDEIHKSKSSDTDQGHATRRLIEASPMTLGLTGTLYGGKSSSVYTIEFSFSNWVKDTFPWPSGTPTHWIKVMGGLKDVYVTTEGSHGASGNKRYAKVQGEEIPAASPELLSAVFPHSVFIALEDLGHAMPQFDEVPKEVAMDPDQASVYNTAVQVVTEYHRRCLMAGDGSATGMRYRYLLQLPDSVFRENKAVHRTAIQKDARRKEYIAQIVHVNRALPNIIIPKEQLMFELIEEYLADGRRVIIHPCQTGDRTDIQDRLLKLIEEHVTGAKPFVMRRTVPPKDRIKYIAKKVEGEKHNVLICNPVLVAEGVDLILFSRTIYFEIHPSLYVMAQSSRRTWRLNQPENDVRVDYIYYDDIYQNAAVTSVAEKTAAANILYGAEGGGLSAMSNSVSVFETIVDSVEKGLRLTEGELREKFKSVSYTEKDYQNSPWYVPIPRKAASPRLVEIQPTSSDSLDDEDIDKISALEKSLEGEDWFE